MGGGGIFTEEFELMAKGHAVSVAVRRVKIFGVHAKDGCHEGEWEEDDGDNGEEHNGAALLDAFVCSLQGVFGFYNTCLLLFETEKVLELFFS